MKKQKDYTVPLLLFCLLLALAMFFVSCSKDADAIQQCPQVTIYMDSLSGGKVVSTFLMYDQPDCDNTFKDGEQFICDSNHVRRIIVHQLNKN